MTAACPGVLLLALAAASPPGSPEDVEFFEKRIRPLLVAKCYRCHSEFPEETRAGAERVGGGLFLDTRAGLRRGGRSGPAILPGEPEKSLLLRAVRPAGGPLATPLREEHRVTPGEIGDLAAWVKSGAPDPRSGPAGAAAPRGAIDLEEGRKHWAYRPPVRVLPPAVRDANWPRGDLDRFILGRLEARGLRPAADADAATLARRAFFDLHGLPPSPEELARFLADARPDAYERLVDRLLASPRFAERWGRHWLDVARFAESVTLRGFIFREAWRYRDYVIDAFRRDLPFDRFIREQIAGDLLPAGDLGERQRQLIATGFLVLGNTNLEEQDKAQLRMDVVDEQLDTIGKAFLAQTIGCARCHDHKFDPIPTADYYALAGILANAASLVHANVSNWIEVPLPLDPAEEARLRAREESMAVLEAKLKGLKEEAVRLARASGPAAGPAVVAAGALAGIVVDSSQAKAVGEWKHSIHSGRYIGDGYLHDLRERKGAKTLTFHPEIVEAGSYEVRFAYQPGPDRAAAVPLTILHAGGESVITVDERLPPAVDGRFVSLGQFRFEANGQGYLLLSTEGTEGYVTADAVQLLPAAAARPAGAPAPGSGAATAANDLAARIAETEARLKSLQREPRRPMVMSVREEKKASDARIHRRGSVHTLGEEVPRGFLRVANRNALPEFSATASGRRELADWIASPENPLTARVLANRVWHWLFGSGLVRTTDNFGTTGEAPSHPELLDHLALRLVENGWSIKALIREIMLSRTYRLSSAGDPAALAADPENRLRSRADRRRLDVECVRDAILSVSGRLRFSGGGPAFPAGLTADYGYRSQEPLRSVYLPVFRNALPEIFEPFDFADPSVVTGARGRSVVPQQALFLLNHPSIAGEARAAAERLLAAGPAVEAARLDLAFRAALGRPPAPAEATAALDHLRASEAAGEELAERWAGVFQALFGSIDFRYLR